MSTWQLTTFINMQYKYMIEVPHIGSSSGRSGSFDVKQAKRTRTRKGARCDTSNERSPCTDQVPPKLKVWSAQEPYLKVQLSYPGKPARKF